MNRRGWIVVLAGTGLNLALGILYAWSVFSKQIVETVEKGGFGWTKTTASLPYTVACGIFAIMMIPAGRLQDRVGPRVVASAGAVLTGLGCVVASFSSAESVLPAIIGFGVLGGSGIGLGYAAATPAAVKWFPPEKKGLITGVVVGGFGIAPVYIAPLSKYLISTYGVAGSFRILGVAFLVAGCTKDATFVEPIPPLAAIHFVHAVPDTMAMDFRVVDIVSNAGLFDASFRTANMFYTGIEAGSRQIRVFISSTNEAVTKNPIYDTTFAFTADADYTFIHTGFARTGQSPARAVWIVPDNATAPAAGQIGLRLIHAGAGSEPCIDEFEVFTAGDSPRNVALASSGGKASASSEYPGAAIHKMTQRQVPRINSIVQAVSR